MILGQLIYTRKGSIFWKYFELVLQLSLRHNFIQQTLNSGFAQIQILLAACQRLAMMRMSDRSPLKLRLNFFRRLTIPKKTIHHHQ